MTTEKLKCGCGSTKFRTALFTGATVCAACGRVFTVETAFDPDAIDVHVARDDEAKRAGVVEAEARIVAWLRRMPGRPSDDRLVAADIARDIERGEHRR